jgi:hypothetical protein
LLIEVEVATGDANFVSLLGCIQKNIFEELVLRCLLQLIPIDLNKGMLTNGKRYTSSPVTANG